MASPLQLNVSEVLRQLGQRMPFTRYVVLDGLAVTDARVPEGVPVHLQVDVESTASGAVAVSGTVTAPWEGSCRRCLGPVTGEAVTDVAEVYERTPVEGDTYPLVGDVIDLDSLVRDAVVLALPLAPLCRDDCPGPVPEAFPVTPEADLPAGGDGAAPERPIDPRWAALDQLREP